MNAVWFAIILSTLYEILYRQTNDGFYRFGRKVLLVAAGVGIIIEIARLV